jgi:hypothetical protein
MYPHQIRLRDPWEREPLSDSSGRIRFRRRFSWVAALAPHERVWLTFAGAEGSAEVTLNGLLLGRQGRPGEKFEFEVTSLLRTRNELDLVVDPGGSAGASRGDVALEVRCSAYLRGVRWWIATAGGIRRLHIAGELVGTADRELEIYALLNDASVIYSTLTAEPAGRSFELSSEPLPQPTPRDDLGSPVTHRVRVELVNAAVKWFCIDGTIQTENESLWQN